MASEDLNLTGLKSLQQALERTPTGAAAVLLARRMGIWTASAHNAPDERAPFHKDLSTLEHSQLSRLLGTWTAEYGRIIELNGVLIGQDQALKIELKSAQAAARSRVRRDREAKELKPLSVSDLKDTADEDPAVVDLYERATLLVILLASAGAAKEATAQYLASISREIAFRDVQMKARIYG